MTGHPLRWYLSLSLDPLFSKSVILYLTGNIVFMIKTNTLNKETTQKEKTTRKEKTMDTEKAETEKTR